MNADKTIRQSLAMVNNYLNTGRPERAADVLRVVESVAPRHPDAAKLWACVAQRWHGNRSEEQSRQDLFGKDWKGESLDGKSITVYCDQGMGDVLNLLCYLAEMKRRWKCYVNLNCYSFYSPLKRLFNGVCCYDTFSDEFVRSDYFVNLMSVPAVLHDLPAEYRYPAFFREILKHPVPPQVSLGEIRPSCVGETKPKVGVAWRSNAKNWLSEVKSIDAEEFCEIFPFGVRAYSLIPDQPPPGISSAPLHDLIDTASLILAMDVIVSVDTAVLHLAGLLNKPTIGLLHKTADPRWGDSDTCVWYPSVTLRRQTEEGDWRPVIKDARNDLENVVASLSERS